MAPGYHHKTKTNKRHRSRSASIDQKETQRRKTETALSEPHDPRKVVGSAPEKNAASKTNRRRKKARNNTRPNSVSVSPTITARKATVTDLPDELKMMVFRYVSALSSHWNSVVSRRRLALLYRVEANLSSAIRRVRCHSRWSAGLWTKLERKHDSRTSTW
jgi:hypothetical protein